MFSLCEWCFCELSVGLCFSWSREKICLESQSVMFFCESSCCFVGCCVQLSSWMLLFVRILLFVWILFWNFFRENIRFGKWETKIVRKYVFKNVRKCVFKNVRKCGGKEFKLFRKLWEIVRENWEKCGFILFKMWGIGVHFRVKMCGRMMCVFFSKYGIFYWKIGVFCASNFLWEGIVLENCEVV